MLSSFMRIVTLLASLAIIAVTTAGSAHLARMGNVPNLGGHAARMVQVDGDCAVPCVGEQRCESVMAGLCSFAAVGLTGMVTAPEAHADFPFYSIGRMPAPDRVLSGVTPEVTKRPPKNRLV